MTTKYGVYFSDLPDCVTLHSTYEEALERVESLNERHKDADFHYEVKPYVPRKPKPLRKFAKDGSECAA